MVGANQRRAQSETIGAGRKIVRHALRRDAPTGSRSVSGGSTARQAFAAAAAWSSAGNSFKPSAPASEGREALGRRRYAGVQIRSRPACLADDGRIAVRITITPAVLLHACAPRLSSAASVPGADQRAYAESLRKHGGDTLERPRRVIGTSNDAEAAIDEDLPMASAFPAPIHA
jgi:hypothetical protein